MTAPGSNVPAGPGGAPDRLFALLLGDLRSRLRTVCRDWSDAEFERLLLDIAAVKHRWAREEDGH